MAKRAELYHGKVGGILLNDCRLSYRVLNYWNVISVIFNKKSYALYESSKGYFINIKGKRSYLNVIFKEVR